MKQFIFSKWQLEAFNLIKFKNKLLRNFRILPRFLTVASEREVSAKGVRCIQSSNAAI